MISSVLKPFRLLETVQLLISFLKRGFHKIISGTSYCFS